MYYCSKKHKVSGHRKTFIGLFFIMFLIAQIITTRSEVMAASVTESSEPSDSDTNFGSEGEQTEQLPDQEEQNPIEEKEEEAEVSAETEEQWSEAGEEQTEELRKQLPDLEEQKSEEENEQGTEEIKYDKPVEGNDLVEVEVPIFTADIVNVMVPAAYQVALNPYGFPVRLDDGTISEAQILSKDYGIVNKSSRDMLVTVTLCVEDLNAGKIQFVDSPEEVEGTDTYAVYLALVPADESGVRVGNGDVDMHVTREELSDISMTGTAESASALHKGINAVTFKLSKAVYHIIQTEDAFADLISLAPDGTGVTAFTFAGAVNKNADWMELSKGIRISAVYTYEAADGSEEIVEGTGAMILGE